jgi:hypothetical protein
MGVLFAIIPDMVTRFGATAFDVAALFLFPCFALFPMSCSKLNPLSLVIASLGVLSICAASYADSVYKSVDSRGRVIYTSKPPAPGAKPATLPKIARQSRVPSAPPGKQTCKGHGDVSCDAGPDVDGSVLCSDGFRDASARFNFTCKASRLEIADISEITKDGTMTVIVRNLKGVEASAARVRMLSDTGDEITLKGPVIIEGYGVGEYLYEVPPNAPLRSKPGKAQLTVECLNCP